VRKSILRQVGCDNFYAIIHVFHCIENE
jgi:hypothetical protein